MIRVDELQKVEESAATTSVASRSVEVEHLTAEDTELLHALDAMVEEALSASGGKEAMFATPPVPMQVPGESDGFPPRVINALKQLWESGGWIVAVFRAGPAAVQIIFAKSRGATLSQVERGLEARNVALPQSLSRGETVLGSQRAPKMTTPLLLRMPTRGRPEQAIAVLTEYRRLAADHVAIEVIIDEDDVLTNETRVLKRLYDLDCTVTVGKHKSKIDAVNGGRVDDWAILALISDDMVPVVEGYDRRIVADMRERFPFLDGAIYYDDGYNKDHVRSGNPILCTLPIMGRHLWEQFGYVYYPAYGSLYSDDEQTQILTEMRRLAFIDARIIEHRHHAAGKAPFDMLYKFNDEKWGKADQQLFLTRAQLRQPGAQFAFDAPPMWLSILICSTHERAGSLRKLEEHLRAQMRAYPREVELLVEIDGGERSVGEKRQRLLERAVGHYVAHVDDDDWVDSRYVKRVLEAVRGGEVDCASLVGAITTNGERPEEFRHSIEYRGWYTEGGVHYRTPNHLNAVRRELALKVGFASKNVGEDHDFSKALHPLLHREGSTGDEVLYHYWFCPKKSVQLKDKR